MKKVKVYINQVYEIEVADSIDTEDNSSLNEAFAEYLSNNNMTAETEFWDGISFKQIKKVKKWKE